MSGCRQIFSTTTYQCREQALEAILEFGREADRAFISRFPSSRHFTNVFQVVKDKAKDIQAGYDKRHDMQEVSNFKVRRDHIITLPSISYLTASKCRFAEIHSRGLQRAERRAPVLVFAHRSLRSDIEKQNEGLLEEGRLAGYLKGGA